MNRSGKLILDEADTYGVEMALQLVDKAGGGEVTVVSMGSSADVAGLRNALAMGAAKAVIVSDDVVARHRRALDRQGAGRGISRDSPDLVLAATESSDGYTGTTPVQWRNCSDFLRSRSQSPSPSTVPRQSQRQTEAGYDEVTAPLPALVTVTAGVVEPRYASFKGIMAAKSKPLEILSVRISGSMVRSVPSARVETTDVGQAAESRQAGEKYVDEGDGAESVVGFLESIKVL